MSTPSGIRLQPHRISGLTAGIASGIVALPEFQRDFDWTDEQVASLIATVIKGWPAGSLLLMDGREDLFFREREFEAAPELRTPVELIVLDGQQRLTGLYQAVYDTGRYVYAIRAEALTPEASVDDIEDAVMSIKRSEWDEKFRDVPWSSFDEGLIPLYALRSPTDYFSWREATVQHAQMSQGERKRLGLRLSDAYRQGLEAFHQYDLPAVIVERSVEPAAVARIFERVNTTGIPLTTFDLMVARTFKENWNLRDHWDAALATYDYFPRFFGDNGLSALQVVALEHGNGVRQSDVLDLDPALVRAHWHPAVEALDAAVTALVDSCGVFSPSVLPYPGLLLTLAGAAVRGRDLGSKRKIRRWFFSRTFGRRYEVAANTVTLQEVAILENYLTTGEKLPKLRMSANAVAEGSRRRQGALWRGFMCALAADAPTALDGSETDEVIPVAVVERQEPVRRGKDPQHLLIPAFVLASRHESRTVGYAGAERLMGVLRELPPSLQARVRKRQLIPDEVDNDSEFLKSRIALLDAFLSKTTGQGLEWDEEH